MTLSAKGVKRLEKVHDKLREFHETRLAVLHRELADTEEKERELAETFERLSNLAALSGLGFVRRINSLRMRAKSIEKQIAETRGKLAKIMAAQDWLAAERARLGEAASLAETQEEMEEWVETQFLDVSPTQGNEPTFVENEADCELKRSAQ